METATMIPYCQMVTDVFSQASQLTYTLSQMIGETDANYGEHLYAQKEQQEDDLRTTLLHHYITLKAVNANQVYTRIQKLDTIVAPLKQRLDSGKETLKEIFGEKDIGSSVKILGMLCQAFRKPDLSTSTLGRIKLDKFDDKQNSPTLTCSSVSSLLLSKIALTYDLRSQFNQLEDTRADTNAAEFASLSENIARSEQPETHNSKRYDKLVTCTNPIAFLGLMELYCDLVEDLVK